MLGAQKTRLVETVLLGTHNICFGRDIRTRYYKLRTLLLKLNLLNTTIHHFKPRNQCGNNNMSKYSLINHYDPSFQ